MTHTTTITATIDTKTETYTLSIDPAASIPSGGTVVLQASGASTVTLAASPSAPQPFGDMRATSSGQTTSLARDVLGPVALSVQGFTGTPLTIVPQLHLTLSSAADTPSITVQAGADVKLTTSASALMVGTSLNGSPVDLFVGEKAGTVSLMSDTMVFTVGDVEVGHYDLSTAESSGPQVPLKGKINVSSSTGK